MAFDDILQKKYKLRNKYGFRPPSTGRKTDVEGDEEVGMHKQTQPCLSHLCRSGGSGSGSGRAECVTGLEHAPCCPFSGVLGRPSVPGTVQGSRSLNRAWHARPPCRGRVCGQAFRSRL